MMKKIPNIALSNVLLALFAFPAVANASEPVAVIKNVDGSVLIEHNGQRIPAKNGMYLQENDVAFVLEKSTLDLAYSGCNSTLEQNTLLTIHVNEPCGAGDIIGVGAVQVSASTQAVADKAYAATIKAGAKKATVSAFDSALASGASQEVARQAAINAAASKGIAKAAASAFLSGSGTAVITGSTIALGAGGLATTAVVVNNGDGGGSTNTSASNN